MLSGMVAKAPASMVEPPEIMGYAIVSERHVTRCRAQESVNAPKYGGNKVWRTNLYIANGNLVLWWEKLSDQDGTCVFWCQTRAQFELVNPAFWFAIERRCLGTTGVLQSNQSKSTADTGCFHPALGRLWRLKRHLHIRFRGAKPPQACHQTWRSAACSLHSKQNRFMVDFPDMPVIHLRST